jgi:hypothetical protein
MMARCTLLQWVLGVSEQRQYGLYAAYISDGT